MTAFCEIGTEKRRIEKVLTIHTHSMWCYGGNAGRVNIKELPREKIKNPKSLSEAKFVGFYIFLFSQFRNAFFLWLADLDYDFVKL